MQRRLPQLDGSLFVTDGGIETSLIFNDGLDLPHFAAIDLVRRPGGEEALRRYFEAYVAIAARHGAGVVLESATWRASADWGRRLGFYKAANNLTLSARDPLSHQPELKACAVRLRGL